MVQPLYAAVIGHIERLISAESMPVETGGGEMLWSQLAPFEFTNDVGYIERLLPAETMTTEAYVGGGETFQMLSAPFNFTNNTGCIERLRPAESAEWSY